MSLNPQQLVAPEPEAFQGTTSESGPPSWYAIWTRSHSEQLVADQLIASGFETFLPRISIWSRRGGIRRAIQVPMFSGYVFLHEFIDKRKYIEVLKARGVVRILGQKWDRLSAISAVEIESLQQILGAKVSVEEYPYLREGQRVRIACGPLRGVEGILVERNREKGFLVLSIELLQRSVAIRVDCSDVDPV